jgi:hypothetical protein
LSIRFWAISLFGQITRRGCFALAFWTKSCQAKNDGEVVPTISTGKDLVSMALFKPESIALEKEVIHIRS